MASYENFYSGTDYGLDPDFSSKAFLKTDYRSPASQFGITTDPRSANQLKEVSAKLSTGAKVIEVSGVSPEVLDSIPEQHLDEINRLKKLAGAELTFHGPLVEPTGFTRQGWDETHREQAERQIVSALNRSHRMDPKGNIVVTFHSSNGVPSPETTHFNAKTGKEEIKDFIVVNEQTGQLSNLGPQISYLTETDKEFKKDPKEAVLHRIKQQAEEEWAKALQQVNFHAYAGARELDEIAILTSKEKEKLPVETQKKWEKENPMGQLYKAHLEGKEPEVLKEAEKAYGPAAAGILQNMAQKITHSDIYLRDAFQELQGLFRQAYQTAKRNADKTGEVKDLQKLEAYRQRMLTKKDLIKDPARVGELSEEVVRGVNVLRSVNAPVSIKPFKDFAIDKASDTFGGAAFKAYKKFGDTAPIISIENPPAGAGLARADEIASMIKESRKKFVEKAVDDGLSKSEAQKQAEKLIGATWDVGHINMIRKFGYGKEQLLEETRKIAPFVKHVHLSDNFGLEHTELPMGMGNVPIKEEMEILNKFNKEAKKIIETGGAWYQHFQTNPLRKTLEAFGAPIYSTEMSPQWDQISGVTSSYLSGMGEINPPTHHSYFGAGFQNLPVELGGSIGGGRNRLSGAPME